MGPDLAYFRFYQEEKKIHKLRLKQHEHSHFCKTCNELGLSHLKWIEADGIE